MYGLLKSAKRLKEKHQIVPSTLIIYNSSTVLYSIHKLSTGTIYTQAFKFLLSIKHIKQAFY